MNFTRKCFTAAAVLALPLAAAAEEVKVKAPTVTFNGMVDGYYTLNLDQPQSYDSPTAGAGFWSSAPGFNLGYAKLAATVDAGDVGAKIELGYGKQGAYVGDVLVQQGYVTFKTHGFTIDAGRFYTPAGFEVFDAKDNFLYSRGLLFNFTVPTAHEGVRTAYSLSENLTVTGSIANGSDLWANDVGHSETPYKTVIGSVAYTKDATAAYLNLFYSKIPETDGENAFQADVVLSQGFGNLTLAAQGDYVKLADADAILGLGVWAKFTATEWMNVFGRAEYVSDNDMVRSTTADTLYGLTVGAGFPIGENAEVKGELRYDHASEDIYDGKSEPKDGMSTATVSVMAWF
ncbi:MAG: outer membrane beta-barrel protein [Anaeromyxobacter sp.]